MVVSLLVLGSLAVAPVQAQGPSPGLLAFLQQQIALDSNQIAAVQHGDAVVKVLDSPEQRDIALFGIVGSKASREVYIEKVRNFQVSLRAPTRTRFGIFHDPAVAEDVEAVVVSASDVQEVKNCRPGNCVTKLPATDMQRLQSEIDWTAPDLQGRLTALARTRLVEYVTQYRASGDSAMVVYDDRARQHVHSSDVFAALLAASPYLYRTIPSLQRYFAAYPRDTLPGGTEVVFWAEDMLPRLRPILSVTHLVVYAPPELPGLTVIASKQIYANHYFESALDVSCVEDGAPGGAPGSYLFILRRYRFDNLPSGGLVSIKGRAIEALRNLLAGDLKRQKEGRFMD